MKVKVLDFDSLKDLFVNPFFAAVIQRFKAREQSEFLWHEGFPFKENQPYILIVACT